jgi:hypothetical protein
MPFALPVVLSDRLATFWGERDTTLRRPLEVGDRFTRTLSLPYGDVDVDMVAVDVVAQHPTLIDEQSFLLAPEVPLLFRLNQENSLQEYYYLNEVWVTGDTDELEQLPGVTSVTVGTELVEAQLSNPLETAMPRLLTFGAVMLIGLVLVMWGAEGWLVPHQEAVTVLTRIGIPRALERWMLGRWLRALVALAIGGIGGVVLAYLLLPFIGQSELYIPLQQILVMSGGLAIGFAVLTALERLKP